MKIILVAVVLAMLCFSAIASTTPRELAGASVLKLFAAGDFVPYVPTLADVREELGLVQEAHVAKDHVYTYRVAPSGWLALRTSEGLQNAVEEVIYSRFPPSPSSLNQVVGKNLLSNRLLGVGLGDNVSKIKKRGIAFKKISVELFGRKMTAYECTPKAGQYDLFYRYFVVDNKVEAFSIGVTE